MSDGHFPPILTSESEPPKACPPDTPSQSSIDSSVSSVSVLGCDSCNHSRRESLESTFTGEIAVRGLCPMHSLMCAARSILQQCSG